jgi:asparagine synthetase B (glutamine-hydrolysing)
MDLGFKPTCYTFHLSYFVSTDAKAARSACTHWGVPIRIVHEAPGSVRDHLRDVIRTIKSARKTHVEVMYGYWWLMQAVKERHVFSGLQADTLYGSNKNAAIRCGKASAAEFTRYRRELLKISGQEGLAQAQMLAGHFGKILHAPYSDDRVRRFFCQFSWAQLNRPKQKMPAINAFRDRFDELPIYRHDDNMQCGSRLREHCAPFVKEYRKILAEVGG